MIVGADPQDFMNELAANASSLGVGIVFYSGNDDSLLPHRGTESAEFIYLRIGLMILT